tara:strand:- start:1277 stop:3019 length:1743 start_codon:yes stop_codon:yes gene_type:complete
MKFSLFTTKITESCYSESNKLFLGKWCLASELESNKLGEYKIAEYHWDNSKKIDKDYKYLYEFYYQTLDVLSKHLNRMHKRNEDQRYWHIIIGAWLYKFLVSSFDKWESSRLVIDNYDISKIFYYKTSYLDLIPSDCTEFNKVANTELWNNFIYTEIIKFQKREDLTYKEIKHKSINNEKNYQVNKYYEKSNLSYRLFDKFLSLMPSKSEVVLYKTYFGKLSDLKIFTKSKTIPRIYTDFDKTFALPLPQNREKNLEFVAKNSYENFINKNIFKFMPISYLEGFDKIENYCNKIKLSPKVIISAVGDRCDLFSIWVANKIEKSIYFCSEHGGATEDTNQFDARNKKGDCFLSWNYSEKKNVHQIPPHFYTKKIKKRLLIKGTKLSIILSNSSTIYNHHLHYNLKGKQSLEVYEQLKSLKKLPNKIKDNLHFRLHPNSNLWLMNERINADFGKNFIFKQKKLDDVFMESKILINMDFQTSFYQSMFSGKPVIVFTTREFTNTFNPKIKKLFESFKDLKIVITKTSDLILHIENIWSDPYRWWDSNEIKNLREEFNSLCSKKPNKKFADEIMNLRKKYEKVN